jgi:hypothetical protein
VVDAGGIVVEVLATGATGNVRNDLDAWITTYDLTVTTMGDAPGAAGQTLQLLGVREATVIVELPTMRVVWYDDGDQSGLLRTAADMAIDEALRLLPP